MPREYTRIPLEERFWPKVDKTPGFGPWGNCWRWTASVIKPGYGRIQENGKTLSAHRASYRLAFGSIPDGLCVLHRCDNPPCVNPTHLFLGTNADNSHDMVVKGRSPRGDMSNPRRFRSHLRRGATHPCAVLTEEQVKSIRQRYDPASVTYKEMAAEYGVTPGTIGHIVRRVSWTHI